MTRDEFQKWFRHHCSRFTGIRAWLDKTTRGVGAPDEAEILRAWYGTLCKVELTAAKAASDSMHSGEVDEPKGFDRHPAAIRKAAGTLGGASDGPLDRVRYDNDGNRTYGCLVCLDDGWVICWHPVSMKAAKAERLGELFTLYTTAVCCDCSAGQERNRGGNSVTYNPQTWLLLHRTEDGKQVIECVSEKAEQDRLVEWMSNYKSPQPENHEAAFDAFEN